MITLALFAAAALGGVFLAMKHFKGETPPLIIALAHGVIGAAGLVTLIFTVSRGDATSLLKLSLVLFVVAALGGFYLFSFRLQKKLVPPKVIAIHALISVAAFGVLVKESLF